MDTKKMERTMNDLNRATGLARAAVDWTYNNDMEDLADQLMEAVRILSIAQLKIQSAYMTKKWGVE